MDLSNSTLNDRQRYGSRNSTDEMNSNEFMGSVNTPFLGLCCLVVLEIVVVRSRAGLPCLLAELR